MIGGDCQFDSPGHNAKFCICSLQNLGDKKIIDFFVHQKGIEPGDLEKYACQACLTRTTAELGEKQIFTFLSDRHRGVAKMVRERFPEIYHSFDVWHLSKSLSKKLSKAATKYPLLAKWRDSILLHLWFSCANCNENEDHLIELFLSLLNHIQNKHSWSGGAFVNKCGHGRLGRRAKNKMWLNNRAANPGNNTDAEFSELNKIINNKSFLNDLKHAKYFLHSGDVEMYHNERLVLLPKRLHFSYEGTMMRSTLAVLDHNYNVGRKVTGSKVVWSKASKSYIVKNVYEKKSNQWRKDILNSVMSCLSNPEQFSESNSPAVQKLFQPYEIPANIAPVEKPVLEDLLRKKFSRFKK
ncbi:hypothetical protein B566_EDAN018171 [Ephemera danica]|nr:hypothetical protein B566_EDAN018171 [Ephemera danica]